MATNKDINFNLNAKDRATEEIKKVNKSLDGLGTEAKNAGEKFKGTFTELNNKIQTIEFALGKFKQVFKTAFDWGEQGATVIQTYESFEMLLASIGAAPDLLEQLTEKSKGTISQLDLMSSTATLLAGASGELGKSLADATPELLEIAKAANKLNPALGDTTFFYESLATGIKRSSPLLIDNLGIKLKIGEANERLAKQLGKTVEQLTVEEQQMALLNETLRVGGNIIEQVGGETDSLTDSFARMNAAIENETNALKTKLTPAMINAADAVTLLLTWNDKLDKVMEEHEKNVIKTSNTYSEYKEEMIRVAEAGKVLAKWQLDEISIFLDTGHVVKAHRKEMGYWLKDLDILTKEQWEAAQAAQAVKTETERWQAQADAHIATLEKQAEVTDLVKLAADQLKESQMEYKIFLAGALGKENEKYADSLQDLNDKAGALRDKIAELGTKKYRTKEQEEELQGLIGDLEGVRSKVEEVKNEHDLQTKQILLNLIEQRLGIDGITQAEQEFLLDLAGNWELVDQTTVQAWKKIGQYIDGVDEATLKSQGFLDVISGVPKELTIKVRADFISNIPSWVWDNTSPAMGGGGSSGGGFEMRASGGDVRPGGSYVVGEHGMEILQLGADGRGMITPLNTSITNNYNLGVTTMQNLDTVTTGFAILQAMQ